MSEQAAVAYMRCSGASQVDRDSFPRQTAAIASCCRSKGFELIHEYREEAVPGKFDEEHRPAFQQMISDLLGNGCRTIIVENMSRLAREYRTQEHLIIYIASKGITLISADTGEDITAAMMGDPMRRALVQIQGIFSELDKNLLVAKLRKARDRQRELTGRSEGRKTFGSKPGEAEAIHQMRSLKAAGLSCDKIADALNANGVPARGTKKRTGPWLGCTIARILKREAASCETT
jgi:DNA invertase Pin-like site-specific DNA recombinase